MSVNRRTFIKAGAAGASLALSGCAAVPDRPLARVVVIGGGYGGATAAKYLRLWEPRLDVTLVERNEAFVSCPISNLVLAGTEKIENLTVRYDGLRKYGVRVVRDDATAIDYDKRVVRLARGDTLPWDRLIVAPGIDFQYEQIPGLDNAAAQSQVLHAWKAGPQTVALRRQLEAMPDGGVFAISIPRSPYRCPPGPYERASVVADYFRQYKPKSKVLVLDANADVVSKPALFRGVWAERYKGIVEYRPNSELVEFDVKGNVARMQVEDVKASLFNIIPPQRAGNIARELITVNRQWCGVEFLGFESLKIPGVHVIGDATAPAPAMPKSGFMANNHAKVAADAVIAKLTGQPLNTDPIIANTCYSFLTTTEAVHVASVHKYDRDQKTLVVVKGSGGLSPARTVRRGSSGGN
jgi:NADPH-dependent 2,4-dienoyl-CoA reductase/sulfur reductase-like enzyme